MPGNPHTALRSRTVAAELRRLREQRALSPAEAARRSGVPAGRLGRIEAGADGLRIADVVALLGLYRVPAAQREELLGLIRRSDEEGWWLRRSELPTLWRTLLRLQEQAVRITDVQLMLVPQLLQTPEYTAALLAGLSGRLSEPRAELLAEVRAARERLLARPSGAELVAVVDESALHLRVGGKDAMGRQLRHLIEASRRPGITLRVLPRSIGAHAGMQGPFLTYGFPSGAELVALENRTNGMFFGEDSDLALYRRVRAAVLAQSLDPEPTRALIAGLAAELARAD